MRLSPLAGAKLMPVDLQSTNLAQTPLISLTFIAAPALLTNASSLLANSVTLRFLRTRELMRDLYNRSRRDDLDKEDEDLLHDEVDRVQKQAFLMLRALYAVYVALGSFASATLLTLVSTSVGVAFGATQTVYFAWGGVLLGIIGVSGLVISSINLIQATKMSLMNINLEAENIRRQRQRRPIL